jgi:hypothetical protein
MHPALAVIIWLLLWPFRRARDAFEADFRDMDEHPDDWAW